MLILCLAMTTPTLLKEQTLRKSKLYEVFIGSNVRFLAGHKTQESSADSCLETFYFFTLHALVVPILVWIASSNVLIQGRVSQSKVFPSACRLCFLTWMVFVYSPLDSINHMLTKLLKSCYFNS